MLSEALLFHIDHLNSNSTFKSCFEAVITQYDLFSLYGISISIKLGLLELTLSFGWKLECLASAFGLSMMCSEKLPETCELRNRLSNSVYRFIFLAEQY